MAAVTPACSADLTGGTGQVRVPGMRTPGARAVQAGAELRPSRIPWRNRLPEAAQTALP